MKVALLIALAGWGAWISAGEHFPWAANPIARRELVAACLILEAGGEGPVGMQAVMNVIANRAAGRADRFYTEVMRPKQFSAMSLSAGQGSSSALVARAQKHSRWSQALDLVSRAASRQLPDITGGATHYYALSAKQPPSWSFEMTPTTQIKGHAFFRAPAHDPIARRALVAL